MSDFYQILGVSRYASAEEIRKAYKSLAKKFHPDKNPGNSYFEEQFKLINEAYHVLSDSTKKNNYDYKLLYSKQEYQAPTYSTAKSANKTQNTKSARPKQKKEFPYKYHLISFGILLLIGIGSIVLYHFMNTYTANLRLAEAKAEIQKGRLRQANLLLMEALHFNENLSEAYYLRGKIIVPLIGKYDYAVQFYTNAISSSDTFYTAAYFERAKCHLRMEKLSSSLSDLNALAEKKNSADSVFWYRGELHYFLDDYKKASVDLLRFYQTHPDCGDCLSKILYSELQLNRFKNAIRIYQSAISSGADTSVVSPYIVAISYLGVNDSIRASEYIKKLEDGGLEKKSATDLLNSLHEKKE
jgi:hypothetical protein